MTDGIAPRRDRRRVDGVLLLDKPLGLTSNAALQRAKRLFFAEKAGHTGTLDPLATGLLPICFGEATKFSQALFDARKGYVATLHFGVATTTGDAEGEIVREAPACFTRDDLARVIPRFIGAVEQVPPRYAALKFQGRKYYEYARAGVEIPRTPRTVEIDAIEIVDWALPSATLRIACGKGTYIRVLAEDLAASLGTLAHLRALRRTATAPFTVAGAVDLDALEAMPLERRDAALLAIDAPLAGFPRLTLDRADLLDLVHGKTPVAPIEPEGRYRAYDPAGAFAGLVELRNGLLRSVRIVRSARAEPDWPSHSSVI